jgi:hypothetical protein
MIVNASAQEGDMCIWTCRETNTRVESGSLLCVKHQPLCPGDPPRPLRCLCKGLFEVRLSQKPPSEGAIGSRRTDTCVLQSF